MSDTKETIKTESHSSISPVRLSLIGVDKIEADIKSCLVTKTTACGQWCGSNDCSPDCANSSEYEQIDKRKLEKVIEGWANEA